MNPDRRSRFVRARAVICRAMQNTELTMSDRGGRVVDVEALTPALSDVPGELKRPTANSGDTTRSDPEVLVTPIAASDDARKARAPRRLCSILGMRTMSSLELEAESLAQESAKDKFQLATALTSDEAGALAHTLVQWRHAILKHPFVFFRTPTNAETLAIARDVAEQLNEELSGTGVAGVPGAAVAAARKALAVRLCALSLDEDRQHALREASMTVEGARRELPLLHLVGEEAIAEMLGSLTLKQCHTDGFFQEFFGAPVDFISTRTLAACWACRRAGRARP